MTVVAPRTPHRWIRRYWWVSAAIVGAILLFFAAEPRASTAIKDDSFITAGTSGILNIEPGECFTDPVYSRTAGEVVVRYLPCEERADNQSYGFLQAEEGPWDRPALAAFAWERCGQDFTRRWTSQASSGLNFYPILPTAESWADGDRDIMCVVYRPAGKLTRSAVPLLH